MIPLALWTCALMAQQLSVQPFPGVVGEPVTIRAVGQGAPLAGLAIQLESAEGASRSIGSTGGDGGLQFVPTEPGYHTFVATIDGIRNLAPLAVVPARRRAWWAIVTVPLAVSLLWSARRRQRGGPGRAAAS